MPVGASSRVDGAGKRPSEPASVMTHAPGSPEFGPEFFAHRLDRGFRWGVLVSIIGPIAWLSFTLLYVGFWAQGFSLFQSIVLIVVSLLILAGVMGSVWTAWGMRRHTP